MLISYLKNIFTRRFSNADRDTLNIFDGAAENLNRHVNLTTVNEHDYFDEDDKNKASVLKNLGFDNSSDVKEVEEQFSKFEKIKNIHNVVDYFSTFYPLNKYLLYNQVKTICETYGFVCSELKNYIGAIPDNNFQEIKEFSLREQDLVYYGLYSHEVRSFGIDSAQHLLQKGFELSSEEMYDNYLHFNERKFPHNKKIYFKGFPLLVCTQLKNLKIEQKNSDMVNVTIPKHFAAQFNLRANKLESSFDLDHPKEVKYSEEIKKELDQQQVSQQYNKTVPYTVILQPVFKFDVYGFLIITTIKDGEQRY